MIEKSSKNKCTVLVNSCDGYDDLWYPFFELFKKFWANCPYEIVLNTESKMYENPDLDIRCCNCQSKNLPYGKRLKNCLKTIKTPYVILMLDDFFLRKPVNQNFLDKIISYLDNNLDVACFNFDIQHDRYDIDDGRFPVANSGNINIICRLGYGEPKNYIMHGKTKNLLGSGNYMET